MLKISFSWHQFCWSIAFLHCAEGKHLPLWYCLKCIYELFESVKQGNVSYSLLSQGSTVFVIVAAVNCLSHHLLVASLVSRGLLATTSNLELGWAISLLFFITSPQSFFLAQSVAYRAVVNHLWTLPQKTSHLPRQICHWPQYGDIIEMSNMTGKGCFREGNIMFLWARGWKYAVF